MLDIIFALLHSIFDILDIAQETSSTIVGIDRVEA